MRILVLFLLLFSLHACVLQVSEQSDVAVASQEVADPASIVTAFYSGEGNVMLWSDDPDIDSEIFSKHLAQLYSASLRKYGQFALTFDPVVNGQDALITDLVVHPAIIDGDRAQVYVRFYNFDFDNAMIYSFVFENAAWKLDEIASVGGETRWLLSDVLNNP